MSIGSNGGPESGVKPRDPATPPPAPSSCRFCKSALDPAAKICPECQQWQEHKGRKAEQWLALFGALTGVVSTLILVGTYARDRLSEPRHNLVASRASCEKTGVIVEVTNTGRAPGFVPHFATERMSKTPEQGLDLFLAESMKVAPGDTVEAEYRPRDGEEIQVNSDPNCRRGINVRGLETVTCDSCMLL